MTDPNCAELPELDPSKIDPSMLDEMIKSKMPYDQGEADDFLDKVADVQQQVKDIIAGKIDVQELDRKEKEAAEKERLKQVANEIRHREAQEKLRKGRPGKGHQGGYLTFCPRCFREFTVEGITECPLCGKPTQTEAERMDYLRTRLEEHKQKMNQKKTRRAKWENWKKT